MKKNEESPNMCAFKEAKWKKIGYRPYAVEEHDEYVKLIKVLLKHADTVCFTVNPFFDSLEEMKNSIWATLYDSVLYMSCDQGSVDDEVGVKRNLLFMKNDYFLYEFFLNKKNMDDFEEDSNIGVVLENPVFIENGEIICYTITHEWSCDVSYDIYEELLAL